MAFDIRAFLAKLFGRDKPVIPVVRLSGMIGGSGPLRHGLTVAGVEAALAKAFATKAPEVAIVINSPGGAAVQSHLIYKRIRALAEEKGKKVIAAIEDLGASGGYMIAAAADEIVVDESSIVGSIGVVSSGFGFTGLIERIGVERRVHTSGKSKAMLDPFRPEREEDVARLRAIQEDVHAAFIELVRSRRGARLADDPELFSGAFWSGTRAVALGLADRTGDLRTVLRERYGKDVRMRIIPVGRGMMRRLGLTLGDRIASGLVGRALAAIEERMTWGRFGL
ncbi:S49 family peptidase [soil metagenome]